MQRLKRIIGGLGCLGMTVALFGCQGALDEVPIDSLLTPEETPTEASAVPELGDSVVPSVDDALVDPAEEQRVVENLLACQLNISRSSASVGQVVQVTLRPRNAEGASLLVNGELNELALDAEDPGQPQTVEYTFNDVGEYPLVGFVHGGEKESRCGLSLSVVAAEETPAPVCSIQASVKEGQIEIYFTAEHAAKGTLENDSLFEEAQELVFETDPALTTLVSPIPEGLAEDEPLLLKGSVESADAQTDSCEFDFTLGDTPNPVDGPGDVNITGETLPYLQEATGRIPIIFGGVANSGGIADVVPEATDDTEPTEEPLTCTVEGPDTVQAGSAFTVKVTSSVPEALRDAEILPQDIKVESRPDNRFGENGFRIMAPRAVKNFSVFGKVEHGDKSALCSKPVRAASSHVTKVELLLKVEPIRLSANADSQELYLQICSKPEFETGEFQGDSQRHCWRDQIADNLYSELRDVYGRKKATINIPAQSNLNFPEDFKYFQLTTGNKASVLLTGIKLSVKTQLSESVSTDYFPVYYNPYYSKVVDGTEKGRARFSMNDRAYLLGLTFDRTSSGPVYLNLKTANISAAAHSELLARDPYAEEKVSFQKNEYVQSIDVSTPFISKSELAFDLKNEAKLKVMEWPFTLYDMGSSLSQELQFSSKDSFELYMAELLEFNPTRFSTLYDSSSMPKNLCRKTITTRLGSSILDNDEYFVPGSTYLRMSYTDSVCKVSYASRYGL
jgi:hypothetical protein